MNHCETNIVLFDGVCNLCNKWIHFIIRNDSKAKFRFASGQSESGQLLLKQLGLSIDHFDSVVYICDNKFYLKSTAVLKIVQKLDGAWHLGYFLIIIPHPLRDMVYNFIAKWRYNWFGKSEACIIPSGEFQARFLE